MDINELFKLVNKGLRQDGRPTITRERFIENLSQMESEGKVKNDNGNILLVRERADYMVNKMKELDESYAD